MTARAIKAIVRLPQSAPGLRPLTLTASPAMVPLLGAPLIEPLLAHLARSGVNEITLLHECFSTEVSDYFRDGRRMGVLIGHVSIEPGAELATQIATAVGDYPTSSRLLYFETPGWTDARLQQLAATQAGSICSLGTPGLRMAMIDPAEGDPPVEWKFAQRIESPPDWRPVATLDQWWSLSLSALRGEAPGVAPPMPEAAPGVFTANPPASWNQADIRGPVWIGPGSRLQSGALVEGPAWIGSGCTIGGRVQLSRCVVENHTQLLERFELHDRYVVRNRAFCADGSTLILGDAMVDRYPLEQDAASSDLARLATRVSGLRSPVFR